MSSVFHSGSMYGTISDASDITDFASLLPDVLALGLDFSVPLPLTRTPMESRKLRTLNSRAWRPDSLYNEPPNFAIGNSADIFFSDMEAIQFRRSASISFVRSLVVCPISCSSPSLFDSTSPRYRAIFIAMLKTLPAQFSVWNALTNPVKYLGFILGICRNSSTLNSTPSTSPFLEGSSLWCLLSFFFSSFFSPVVPPLPSFFSSWAPPFSFSPLALSLFTPLRFSFLMLSTTEMN
mmetsp:Transcript_7882/g.12253  ORF Transcript_7882/g.12253 Transcript_7882/m.12253 type:complete len:236 (+) Transcript_7882:1777-2484(+)